MINNLEVGKRVQSLIEEGKFLMMQWEFISLPLVVEALEKMYNEYFREERENLIGIGKYIGLCRAIADEPDFEETTYGRRVETLLEDLITVDTFQTFIDHIGGVNSLTLNTAMLCGSINAVLESFAPDASRELHLFNLRWKAAKEHIDRIGDMGNPLLRDEIKEVNTIPYMRAC